jgi:hypothetical protein
MFDEVKDFISSEDDGNNSQRQGQAGSTYHKTFMDDSFLFSG